MHMLFTTITITGMLKHMGALSSLPSLCTHTMQDKHDMDAHSGQAFVRIADLAAPRCQPQQSLQSHAAAWLCARSPGDSAAPRTTTLLLPWMPLQLALTGLPWPALELPLMALPLGQDQAPPQPPSVPGKALNCCRS